MDDLTYASDTGWKALQNRIAAALDDLELAEADLAKHGGSMDHIAVVQQVKERLADLRLQLRDRAALLSSTNGA